MFFVIMIYGLFEIHITVDNSQIWKLRMFCQDNKIKPIIAIMPNGDFNNQLMISKWITGNQESVFAESNKLADKMKKYGLNIVRIKIESMANNKNVPQDENDNINTYYEFHIKLPYCDYDELKKICDEFSAAISFSGFKDTINFLITLRYSGTIGFVKAQTHQQSFHKYLENFGYKLMSIQSEYVIYDTRPDYDNGWIDNVII